MTIELHLTTNGESTCVALLGEFEVEGAEQLREQLERLEDEPRPVVDLSQILVVGQTYADRGLVGGGRPRSGPFDSSA